MWMPPAIIKLTNTHLIYFCEADCAAQLSELEMSRRLNDRSLTFWLSGLLPPPLPLQCSLSLSTFSLCCWWSDFMSTPSGWWSLAHHRLATSNLPLPESNNLLVFLVACVFFLTVKSFFGSFSAWGLFKHGPHHHCCSHAASHSVCSQTAVTLISQLSFFTGFTTNLPAKLCT